MQEIIGKEQCRDREHVVSNMQEINDKKQNPGQTAMPQQGTSCRKMQDITMLSRMVENHEMVDSDVSILSMLSQNARKQL